MPYRKWHCPTSSRTVCYPRPVLPDEPSDRRALPPPLQRRPLPPPRARRGRARPDGAAPPTMGSALRLPPRRPAARRHARWREAAQPADPGGDVLRSADPPGVIGLGFGAVTTKSITVEP